MLNGSPRILIIRLTAIGDVVRVLPALHLLREAFPEALIDWAVEKKAGDVVTGHPALDRVHVFERSGSFWESVKAFRYFCKEIRRNRYEMVVDFHGILKTGLIMATSGARNRYGFAPPRSQELSYLFANHRVKLSSKRLNRIEENLVLCEAITGKSRWPNVLMYVPPDVQDQVDAYFEENFESGKQVVAVHVPMERGEKRWPAAHFAQLCDMLLADGRYEVLLTWGPGQIDAVKEVLSKTKRRPMVAPELPDLKHYAWLVHRSALYFGGDTGPMHIASVMGTPVVVVFGGTDPAQHAPYRQPFEVLSAETLGLGADLRTADEKLAAITPEMAYDACVRLTAKREGKEI